MGKAILVLVMFLLFAASSYAESDLSTARSMTAIIEISGHADIIKEASRARVESATVNLSLFPKEGDFTDIDDIEWVPKAKIIGDVAQFNFKDPQESLDYLMKAKITTSQSVVEIRDAIAFPLVSLPNEIEPYIKATKIIDSDDPAINKVASNLVQGETDLYSAVYSIAKWTRENVNCNLSSVTAEVSQKASWVLLERKGVCDEITTLFIALLRSVGIPAKFVTGYAYTTSPLFPSNWGAHGWAEVYFPSVGWVPYDITYGQFGWVDATHIRLSESKDPDDSPTRYEWVGRDSQLEIDDLHISVDVLDSSKDALSMVEVDLKASKQDIGPGSFNAIEAKVRNLRDSYAMTELTLNIPREVRVISKMTRDIMLKPHEERSVFWIVRLDSALEENYLYTYPVSVTGSWDTLDETSFSASVRSAVYSLSQIGEIVDQAQEEQEKVYSSSLSLECSPRSISLYTYEEGKIVCTAANTGNTPLAGLSLCLSKECESLELGISKRAQVEFSIDTKRIGKREERIIAKNSKASKAFDVEVEVLDEPLIEFSGVSLAKTTTYEKEETLSFEIGKASYSIPKNLTIVARTPSGEFGWIMQSLGDNQSFSAPIKGSDLKKGENAIELEIRYLDGNDREYLAKESAMISLEGVTFIQGLKIRLRDMGMWINGLFG